MTKAGRMWTESDWRYDDTGSWERTPESRIAWVDTPLVAASGMDLRVRAHSPDGQWQSLDLAGCRAAARRR